MEAAIKPCKINVPDAGIAKLKAKLAYASFPDDVEFSNDWTHGSPAADIKRLVKYWQNGFDWRAQEAKLNELPQFTTSITVDGFDPIDINFIHQPSKPGSIPLLFCHGWPGSFIEVVKILPLLTQDDGSGPTFHVVAPSLPNFGFSGLVKTKGFGIMQYAEAMHKVMLALGYDKYVTQGGDWGFIITRSMAMQFPDNCLACHVNCLGARPGLLDLGWLGLKSTLGLLSDREKRETKQMQDHLRRGMGYLAIQSTKPSTIGFGLEDSPVALLAWIYEKLVTWTDSYPWTDDEILTWVSIYQFSSAGPAASVRIYYEAFQSNYPHTKKTFEYVPRVPLGVSHYPKEMSPVPASWGRGLGPVVFQAIHDQGGHFAAYECPEAMVRDLKLMFGGKGGAAKVARYFAKL